jgi:type II secretion system protein H
MRAERKIPAVRIVSSRGFSMIEVLVVLAIITIFTGLASVRFMNQLFHHRLNHAVRTLASDLRWARQLAIAEGQPVGIVLDLDQDQYRIEKSSQPGVSIGGIRDLQDRKQGFGDVSLVDSTGGAEITFLPDGLTVDWTTITLRNVKGEQRRITVILTGRVKVL